MDRRGFIISSCAVLLSPTETFSETFAAKETLARIHANVIFLRHALAPGFGDPDNFRLDDCDTQRNLSAAGRDQAVAIGQNMTRAGLVLMLFIQASGVGAWKRQNCWGWAKCRRLLD